MSASQTEIVEATVDVVPPLYEHLGHRCYEVANGGYITHLTDGQVGSFPVGDSEGQDDFAAAIDAYFAAFPPDA